MTLTEWMERLRSMSRVSVVHLEPREAAELHDCLHKLRAAMMLQVIDRSAEGTRCKWCGTESPVTLRQHHVHREGCVLE